MDPFRLDGRTALVSPAVAVVCALLMVAGCARESDPPQSTTTDTTYEVATRTEELVDRSRPTAAAGDRAGRPERPLPTVIHFPVGEGPFPLVVFAHGNTANPEHYRLLLRAWAAAGYVVAAPTFPMSSTRLPGGAGDLVNQPADVSFVLSEMLRLNADRGGPYAGLVDTGRIGVAGHSLGAMTTLGVAFHSCCLDDRIRAGIVLAGTDRPLPNGSFFLGTRTPILVVHGDADPLLPLDGARRIFDNALGPRFLLTVIGGDHDRPYAGAGGQVQPDTRLVITATLDFLDRYLKGRADGLDRLREHLDGEPLARLETRA